MRTVALRIQEVSQSHSLISPYHVSGAGRYTDYTEQGDATCFVEPMEPVEPVEPVEPDLGQRVGLYILALEAGIKDV